MASERYEQLQWAIKGLQGTSTKEELVSMAFGASVLVVGFVAVSLIIYKLSNRDTPTWKKDILTVLIFSPIFILFAFLLIYGTLSGWGISQFILLLLAALPCAAIFRYLGRRFERKQ